MGEYESWELKLAWQEIWQLRGCPPDEVLRGSPGGPELQRHLEICPFCPERIEDPARAGGMTRSGQLASHDRPAADAEPAKVPASPSSAPEDEDSKPETRNRKPPSPSPPAPGQIRSVRTALSGWGPRGRHYNPPLVLVVSIPGEPPEAVRVAQVHPSPPLAGPGDVEVAPGLFAESWNTYALRREDLGKVWEEAPGPALEAVAAASADGLPPSGGEAAPWLDAFRRLEIEAGAFFALQALAGLVEGAGEAPSDALLSRFPEVSDLADALRQWRPQAALPPEPRDVLTALALARFPDRELPLAAATGENRIVLNRAARTGEGIELDPVGAEITLWQSGAHGLTLGGVLDEGVPHGSELHAWWDVPDGPPVPASETRFNAGEGYFRAHFAGLSDEQERQGRPLLLVCLAARQALEASGREE